MLVLSRKENQRILFPDLDVSIEILRVAGNNVRVGIDAPRNIQVIRAELEKASKRAASAKLPNSRGASDQELARARHEYRNRLNSAALAMGLMQKQLERNMVEAAEMTLEKALRELEGLRAESVGERTEETKRRDGDRKALLVEDNANERELMAGVLQLSGYDVDAVDDGLAAIEYLSQEQRPDVVLMDMNMPRMDGATAVKEIRRDPRHQGLKLFAVSGADPRASKVPIGEGGVDRWYSKPLHPQEFVSSLADDFSGDGI